MKKPLKKIVLRGTDPTGNGWYGANRGFRVHQGVDYIGELGETVYACIAGKVRIGRVYSEASRSQFRLVEISGGKESNGTHLRVKQMYVEPSVKNGQWVKAGDKIGTLQGIGDYFGGKMPNHVHIGLWKNGLLTDPEPLIY